MRHKVDDQNPQLSSVENCLICLESGACLLLPEGKGQLPVLTTCEGGAGGWKWVVEKSRRVQVIHLQSLPVPWADWQSFSATLIACPGLAV